MAGRTQRALPALMLGAASMGGGGCHKEPAPAERVKVAAAADLAFAFPDVGALYEKTTGERVVFSFGSTGLLERQLAEGAPFDAFAAASASFADDAVKSGACLADSKASYATGRLVVLAGNGAATIPTRLADLVDPRIAKIAIANPEHAPYGRAARQALERAGIWGQVSSKIVYGENVQQALAFAQSGNGDAAIAALSPAPARPAAPALPAADGGARWTAIPADLPGHIDRVLYAYSLARAGPDAGRRFIAVVNS